MIEVKGNLWTYPADIRVITTNGTVKKNGEAVMGRGCAFEASQKYPRFPKELGKYIKFNGNEVMEYGMTDDGNYLYTFPVKHNWYEQADLGLIYNSTQELSLKVSERFNPQEPLIVVLPRPGCGNGKLKWEDVKPILEPILDDRFHVITF